MGQRALHQGDSHEGTPRSVDALADRLRHLAGFAGPDPNDAGAISDDDDDLVVVLL